MISYENRNKLAVVGENKGGNAILNMYRIPNTIKYYGVVRFNNFAYSFMASERIFRATVYGFKGTVEELDTISKAIQSHMRPNREPACDSTNPDSPVFRPRFLYDFLSKGIMIYKAPGLTDKNEEKYLGYVTSHAFVAYKKGNDITVLYKNVKFIFSVNKFNRRPSTGTDVNKLNDVVYKLIFNVDKQLNDNMAKINMTNITEEVEDFDGDEF